MQHNFFQIEAEITLQLDSGRKTPCYSGYRPGFGFVDKERVQTSGHIELLDKELLYPGEQAIVKITFFHNQFLKDITEGAVVSFYEGAVEIGTAKVLQVLGWVK